MPLDLNQLNLDQLGPEELDALLKQIAATKRKKHTPPVRLRGYVTSVKRHTKSILEAVQKLNKVEGDTSAQWRLIENELRRLAIDRVKDEANNISLPNRKYQGGRKKAASKTQAAEK